MIGTVVRHGRTLRDIANLARHLTRRTGNKSVKVCLDGTIAPDLEEALSDMRRLAAPTNVETAFLHISLNPRSLMSESDLNRAIDILLNRLGAKDGRPVARVFHEKTRIDGAGDRHAHIVISRVGPTGVLRSGFEQIKVETACRVIEYEFEEPVTIGRHLKSSIRQLRREGHSDIADTLALAALHHPGRPKGAIRSQQRAVLKRALIDDRKVRRFVVEVWASSGSADEFRNRLAEHGIKVDRGKRPNVFAVHLRGHFIGALDRIVREGRSEVANRLAGFGPWLSLSAASKFASQSFEALSSNGTLKIAEYERAAAHLLAGDDRADPVNRLRDEDYLPRTDIWGVGRLRPPEHIPRPRFR